MVAGGRISDIDLASVQAALVGVLSAVQERQLDPWSTPRRPEDLVTDEDYRELLEIEARVVAECAAERHTRLAADFHETE